MKKKSNEKKFKKQNSENRLNWAKNRKSQKTKKPKIQKNFKSQFFFGCNVVVFVFLSLRGFE